MKLSFITLTTQRDVAAAAVAEREKDEENQVVVSLALTPRYNSISGVVVSLLAYSHFLIQSHQHNRWLLRERENKCAPSAVWCRCVRMWFAPRRRENERAKIASSERAGGQKELLTARIYHPLGLCRVIGQLDVILARRIMSHKIDAILASSDTPQQWKENQAEIVVWLSGMRVNC